MPQVFMGLTLTKVKEIELYITNQTIRYIDTESLFIGRS